MCVCVCVLQVLGRSKRTQVFQRTQGRVATPLNQDTWRKKDKGEDEEEGLLRVSKRRVRAEREREEWKEKVREQKQRRVREE